MMMNSYYEESLVHNLKDIVWRLNKGEEVTADYDTVSTIEGAIDEIEELRDYELNKADVFNIVTEWGDNQIKELEKDLKEHRLWDVRWSKKNEVTVDMVAEQVIEWYGMSVNELKKLADYKDLKQSGTKEDLVTRLKDKYLDEHHVVL